MQMVREAEERDLDKVAELAALMWTGHSAGELRNEFSEILLRGNARFFLKYEGDVSAGFAYCQLRSDYVEGTKTSPGGYLEGIFVRENCRGRGYGAELLAECEKWARANGCREFASDCEIDNLDSLRFHMAMKFSEANRIICFSKKL